MHIDNFKIKKPGRVQCMTTKLEKIIDDAVYQLNLNLSHRHLLFYPKINESQYDLSDTISIDVSHNRLCEIPKDVCKYVSLERALFHGNRICQVPTAIVNLKALIYLDLSCNNLNHIPQPLCNIPNLKVLLLGQNRLVSLPDEINNLRELIELDASYNELSYIPPSIGSMKRLRNLNLSQNSLVQIPSEIGNLSLVSLDISYNKITHLPTDLRFMCNSLIFLNIEQNPLECPAIKLCTNNVVQLYRLLETESKRSKSKLPSMPGLVTSSKLGTAKDGFSDTSSPLSFNFFSTNNRLSPITSNAAQTNSDNTLETSIINPQCVNGNGELTSESVIKCNLYTTTNTFMTAKTVNHDMDEQSYTMNVKNEDTIHGKQYNEETISQMSEHTEKLNENEVIQLSVLPPTISSHNMNYIASLKNSPKNEHTITASLQPNKSLGKENFNIFHPSSLSGGGRTDSGYSTDASLNVCDLLYLNSVCVSEKNGIDVNKNDGNSNNFTNRITLNTEKDNNNNNNTVDENTLKKCRDKNNLITHVDTANVKYRINQNDNAKALKSPNSVDGNAPIAKIESFYESLPLSPKENVPFPDHKESFSRFKEESDSRLKPPSVLTPNSIVSPISKGNLLNGKNYQMRLSGGNVSTNITKDINLIREDRKIALKLKEMIENRLKITLPNDRDIIQQLSDGVYLCQYFNVIRPHSILTIHVPSKTMPKLPMAKCRRNVDNFIAACKQLQIPEIIDCTNNIQELIIEGRPEINSRILSILTQITTTNAKSNLSNPNNINQLNRSVNIKLDSKVSANASSHINSHSKTSSLLNLSGTTQNNISSVNNVGMTKTCQSPKMSNSKHIGNLSTISTNSKCFPTANNKSVILSSSSCNSYTTTRCSSLSGSMLSVSDKNSHVETKHPNAVKVEGEGAFDNPTFNLSSCTSPPNAISHYNYKNNFSNKICNNGFGTGSNNHQILPTNLASKSSVKAIATNCKSPSPTSFNTFNNQQSISSPSPLSSHETNTTTLLPNNNNSLIMSKHRISPSPLTLFSSNGTKIKQNINGCSNHTSGKFLKTSFNNTCTNNTNQNYAQSSKIKGPPIKK